MAPKRIPRAVTGGSAPQLLTILMEARRRNASELSRHDWHHAAYDTVWRLDRENAGQRVATDADFRPAPIVALSDPGLDGDFVALAYAVLGPNSEPVDVTIALDDDLGVLDITIAASAPELPMTGSPSLLFGVIPRA